VSPNFFSSRAEVELQAKCSIFEIYCQNGSHKEEGQVIPCSIAAIGTDISIGTSGAAKNYITRTRAVKKLQISLPDFRRLCIFKGIYPREPKNKKKVSKGSTAATTFYYTRDIQYLLHEPLLNKFREHKAVAKKIGRALGRGEVGDAKRLEKTHIPKIKLDHLIKERYPTFVDALRDLDDALSMLFLFANLPSHQHVPAKTIALCQRLCLEFEHYVIASHSLRKSFLSIKGIYYQVTIQGQDILWLVPYRFVQRTAGDIDFRIMGTFVEFYTTLLGFVNFRLYTSIGLVYPPKFNAKSEAAGAELAAYQIESKALGAKVESTNGEAPQAITSAEAQAEVDKVAALEESVAQEETTEPVRAEEDGNTDAIDTFEATAQDADILPQPQASSAEVASLFAPFTIYISRETPRAPLEFILKAFGCKRVGWDGALGEGAFTHNESDPSITHQIIDRPAMLEGALPEVHVPETETGGATVQKAQWPRSTMPGRTYVQPQWVWDSINQGKLLRPDLYGPGAELPPHLSPWVKPKKGEYDPNIPLEHQEPEGEAEAFEDEAEDVGDDESDEEEVAGVKDGIDVIVDRDGAVEAGEGMDVDVSGDEEDEEDEDDEMEAEEDWDGFESDGESDVSDGEAARRQHQRELEAEATGTTLEPVVETKKSKNAAIRKSAEKKRKQEEEEKERQKMMLPRRKRKLLKRIEYGTEKRDKEAESLRLKRRRIEKARAAAEAV
jgi:pescadillo protein